MPPHEPSPKNLIAGEICGLVSDEKPLSALPLRTAQRHKRTQAFELFMLWTRSKGLFSILEQRSGWRRGWCLSP
jgi:hypothetical protein